MADTLLESLRATRVDHKAELIWVRFLIDAYHGTGGFTGQIEPPAIASLGWVASEYGLAGQLGGATATTDDPWSFAISYIDQYPREDKQKHSKRVQISHYQNYVETIFDLLLSYAMKKPAVPEGLPDPLKAWRANVTVNETGWWDLMRLVIARRSALMGWCPVLVDKMPTEEGLSEAQVAAAGIRVTPFLTALTPSNILDWYIDTDGVMQWVKIRLTYLRKPDPMRAGETVQVYKIYSRDEIRSWEVIDDKVGQETKTQNPFGEVPLVSFQHKPNVEEPIRGVSMMGDASIASRRLFNLDSEMDEHLRSNVFALLQVPVAEGEEAPKEVLGGSDNAVPVPANATQGYEYVAPPASVAATLETRMQHTVREIFRRSRVQFGGEKLEQSGLAKQWDFEETNRLLSDFVSQLARAEGDAYRLVGKAMQIPAETLEEIRVIPQEDFAVEDLITELDAAEKALALGLGATADMIIKRRVAAKAIDSMSADEAKQVDAELETERDQALNADAEEDEEERAVREAEEAAAAEAEATRLAEEEAARIAAGADA